MDDQLLKLAKHYCLHLFHFTLNAFEEFESDPKVPNHATNSLHLPKDKQDALITCFYGACLKDDPLNNFRTPRTTWSLCHLLKEMYVKMPTESFQDDAGREISYIWNVFHGL